GVAQPNRSRVCERCCDYAVTSSASAPASNAVEFLGREHQAGGRTQPQQGWSALLRARVDSGAAGSRARSRQVLLEGALGPPLSLAEHLLQRADIGLRHGLVLAEAPLHLRGLLRQVVALHRAAA